FFSDRAADIGHTVVEEAFVPLGKLDDFLSEVESIDTRLAFSGILLDSRFVAISTSIARGASTRAYVTDLRTKLRKAVVSLGGYYPGLRAWVGTQERKEELRPVARVFASIKTAVDSRGGIPSPEIEDIVARYSLRKEVGIWHRRLSRSRLRKLWPPKRAPLSNSVRKKLESIVGEGNITFEEFKRYYYTHDLAPLPKLVEIAFKMLPDAVVRPQSTEQVVEIVKLAREKEIPIVGRGGGSWGFGGSIVTQGGILLDLSSMKSPLDLDEERLLAYCAPSITWEELSIRAEAKGLMIGASPSSAPIATVGGWTNTGGAGIGSYRYGTAYSQIAFLKAVMADGGIIDTEKGLSSGRGSGYDINALFSGSEGSLGIVTQLAVKLYPKAEEVRPLAYSFKNVASLQEPLVRIAHSNVVPYNISFYDENNFEFLRLRGKDAPECGSLLSIVLRDSAATNDANEKVLDKLIQESGGKKESEEIARHEWEERSYEMRIRRLGPGGTIGEGVIPTTRFAEMMRKATKIAEEMKMKSTLRGVVVDRNSVAFMPFYISNERFAIESLASMGFVKRIIDEAVRLGGRPSGLGVWFAWNLSKLHGKEGAEIIRNIKDLIDTHNIMNPGKMTEMRMKFGIPVPGFLMDIGLNLLAMAKKAFPRSDITLPSPTS
ncbi:MAG: FAD-binding oxidoreductase, partial [Thermoplasmata archaeon]